MYNKMLDTIVTLAFAFDVKDKIVIVKIFIDLDFRIYSERLDDIRMLKKIKKRTVSVLVEILRNLCRVIEDLLRLLKL